MREGCDYPHFIDERIEVEKGEEFAQFHTDSGRAEFVRVLISKRGLRMLFQVDGNTGPTVFLKGRVWGATHQSGNDWGRPGASVRTYSSRAGWGRRQARRPAADGALPYNDFREGQCTLFGRNLQ